MKDRTNRNLLCSSLALALTVAIGLPLQVRAAEPTPDKMMMGGKGPEHRQAMMEQHKAMMQRCQTMMADMKTQDTELIAQVAKLNSAPKEQKVELLAAIVTDLVKQRAAMNARMQEMQGQMMMPMGKESMPEHPMMDTMGEKPADPSKEQK